ncbi:MAG: S41 family peptidase [Eubacteriales bacterium]
MNNNKKTFIKGALLGALIMFLICGIGAYSIIFSGIFGSSVISNSTIAKLELIQAYIDESFLYEIDEEALEDGIYQGYIAALGDDYAAYYTAEETAELLESTSGEYTGIGALLSQNLETGIVTLVTIFEDSPAMEVGLQDGDLLDKVNGEDITGEDLTNIVTKVKGEEGTTVDITIYRESTDEFLTFTVTRRVVENPTVSYEMLEDQVGYIAVSEFDTITLEQYQEALDDLEAQGMESLVIDLRNNPGGNLETVCDMLELILPEGLIVYTEDKDGNREEYYSSGDNEFTLPLAVLVNGYSASASEIFAGAVQDYGIGEIVGTTTYGKGIVQQLMGLPDDTMIKFTISEYFTPLGRNIHGIGIVPDIAVEYDYDDLETDEQLEKAIEAVTQ